VVTCRCAACFCCLASAAFAFAAAFARFRSARFAFSSAADSSLVCWVASSPAAVEKQRIPRPDEEACDQVSDEDTTVHVRVPADDGEGAREGEWACNRRDGEEVTRRRDGGEAVADRDSRDDPIGDDGAVVESDDDDEKEEVESMGPCEGSRRAHAAAAPRTRAPRSELTTS
jgi:hypothetical protein